MYKEDRRKSKQRTFVYSKYLGVEEKHLDIPIVDNEELRKNLIARIEAATLKIIKQISTGQSPAISYVGQNTSAASDSQDTVFSRYSTDFLYNTDYFAESSISFTEEQSGRESSNESAEKTTVDFAVKRSKNKFVLMTIIMAEAHRLLMTNTTKTRRSFYYDLQNGATKSLVPNQRYVDYALYDVANLLDCTPWDLNERDEEIKALKNGKLSNRYDDKYAKRENRQVGVFPELLATSKGLVAGNMSITLTNNQVIDCSVPGGALIPQIVSNVASVCVKAKFVLVVEKDAAFQKLLEENCPRVLNCILVTGKGYPDIATRLLVNLLSEQMSLPVYIIVDADPFGVHIMLIYRFGSKILSKQNEKLICPNARWLGILPSELIALGAETIPLNETDFAKLRSIEAQSYVNEAMSKQLKILRKGKAEIEAVSSFSTNFLTATYLPYKIDGQDYI